MCQPEDSVQQWDSIILLPLCAAQVPDLSAGEDPDAAFSRVPYEKGFYFLYYLQVGWVALQHMLAGRWRLSRAVAVICRL